MRKRSGALHCQTEEEYTQLAQESYQTMGIFYDNPEKFQQNKEKQQKKREYEELEKQRQQIQQQGCSTQENSPEKRAQLKEQQEVDETPYEKFQSYSVKAMIIGELEEYFIQEIYEFADNLQQMQKIAQKKQQQQQQSEEIEIENDGYCLNNCEKNSENCCNNNVNDKQIKLHMSKSEIDLLVINQQISSTQEIIYKFWLRNLKIPGNNTLLDIYFKTTEFAYFVYESYNLKSYESMVNSMCNCEISDVAKIYILGICDGNKQKVINQCQIEQLVESQKNNNNHTIFQTYEVYQGDLNKFFQNLIEELRKESDVNMQILKDDQEQKYYQGNSISTENSTPLQNELLIEN